MAYFSFQDVSIFFGTGANSNALPNGTNRKTIYANSVQLNYTPNISQQRFLGVAADKDSFGLAGPSTSTLSFTAYITGSGTSNFNPTDYTGDIGDIGTTFVLGDLTNGISGSGLYLNSYSFTLTPYQPVVMQCDFSIYNPLTTTGSGTGITTKSHSPGDVSFGEFAHGAYSSVNGINALQTEVESLNYQFSAQRLPVYEIGSYDISKCELVTAEHSISITSNQINNLVPISGGNYGNVTLDLKDVNSVNTTPQISVDGRVTAQNISAAAGDLARGSVSITQPLK